MSRHDPAPVVRRPSVAGFSVTELMIVTALVAIIMGASVPAAMRFTEAMRLAAAMRDVERELQTARLKAVSTNRPMRVYFNCPSIGRYRMVEVLGVAAVDNASDRCSQTRFSFPSPRDADPNTPSNDGPVREVPQGINLSPTNPSLILQFAPNGQTTRIVTGAPQLLGTTGLDLVVESARSYSRKTVNINGLGRIQVQ